jgi:hypothetical protein
LFRLRGAFTVRPVTFLNAWALGFAGLAPVIVLLYLLKLKRRPLPVSTLLFWQRVLQENRRRAFFQKLRQLLSLLLHLLIFALLLGALAKPTWDRLVREGASTVLVVDARARMQAREGGATRLEKARQLAAGYTRQAHATRQMALLTLGATPRVAAAFTDDERTLRTALDSMQATDATGDLAAAVRLAEDLLASRVGEKRIVVFTDRPVEESAIRPSASAGQSAIAFVTTGSPQDNVAVTRLAARPLLASPQTSEVLLELRNFGAAPARGNVEIRFDGRLLDVKPWELAPGARKLEIFPSVPRPGSSARGWLTARLDAPDALALDDVAYAVLPAPPRRRVLLVSKGNFFLEKLLAADQSVAFELAGPESFTPAIAGKFDVVILDNALPGDFDAAQWPASFLFLGQTPFHSGAAALEQPLVTDLDTEHPVLRLVNLQNVTVVRAAPMTLPASSDGARWTAPIRSFEHPLLLLGERGGRRHAALAFNVAESDLPLRVAFPLLVSNLVQWLAGESAETPRAFLAGETIALAADETLWTEPQTQYVREVKADPARLAREFHEPLRNGYYLRQAPGGPRWVAVNTFSEAESDLRHGAAVSSAAAALPAVSLATLGTWPPWIYLALAAFTLFTLEWWLFHRRRTE